MNRLLICCFVVAAVFTGRGVGEITRQRWTYTDQSAWGDSCTKRNRQTPINIVTKDTVLDASLDSGLVFSAEMGEVMADTTVSNEGYTCQFILPLHSCESSSNWNSNHPVILVKMSNNEGNQTHMMMSGLDLPAADFRFLQFHFHWGTATMPGSEHFINGKQMMAEVLMNKFHFTIRVIMIRVYSRSTSCSSATA